MSDTLALKFKSHPVFKEPLVSLAEAARTPTPGLRRPLRGSKWSAPWTLASVACQGRAERRAVPEERLAPCREGES